MTKLSIVIVNYNVKYFLRQCLQSIYNSDFNDNFEIIVVDNNSKDDSVAMIRSEFPGVNLLVNDQNLGFSRANNTGFSQAKGEYILALNPDTILAQDTLQKSVAFIESQKDAGAVGVKMYDGGGNYLPESKRGFPSPLASFFKLSGLYKLFPKSSLFNAYYEGHKTADENQETDVLTGAFMLMPSEVVKEVNGFDEDYFMYGEDIELSYQIKQLGKKLYYLSDTSIIHFKGESTTKSSVAYLKNFYGAMAIYARKRNNSAPFVWKAILQLGIFFTAVFGLSKMVMQHSFRIILDFGLAISAFYLILKLWATYYFSNPSYYAEAETGVASIIIITISLVIFYFFGHYDFKYNYKRWVYAAILSLFVCLSIYALYPLKWRFSRFVLLIFLSVFPLVLLLSRLIFNRIINKVWSIHSSAIKRSLILGSKASYELLKTNLVNRKDTEIITFIDTVNSANELDNLVNLVHSRRINELICCMNEIDLSDVFFWMNKLSDKVQFKLANNENSVLLGSSSKNKLGEWYTMSIEYKIEQKYYRRAKRLIDISVSLVLLLLFPLLIFFADRDVYKSIVMVLISKKTWIGYNALDENVNTLPKLKAHIFNLDLSNAAILNQDQLHRDNIFYAQNFSLWLEGEQILKAIFRRT